MIRRPMKVATAAAVLSLLCLACSATATATRPASAREFVRLASFGAAVDYNPLASPRHALDHSVVIVDGVLAL